MRTSIVVPCYQEADALGAFAALLPGLEAEEILFVDDGSSDATPARLRDLAAGDPRVRVATHEENRGVGAAMRTGLARARGEIVVVYDADATYAPELVGVLVRAVEAGADVATASPWAEGGAAPDVSVFRRLLSRGAAAAYRRALGGAGGDVRTLTCAFRAYRGAVLPRLPFEADGFGAAAEILGLALLEGLDVVEVPAALGVRREGRSKLRLLPAMREHLAVLRRLVRRRRARSARMTGG